jgi:N-acetylmuramoyl-L-alanine amidase
MRTAGCIRSLFFLWASMSLPSFLVGPADAASTVIGIRHAVRQDETRIVLDMSRKTPYRILSFVRPYRIAVNLKGVKVDRQVYPPAISGGIVEGIRINRLSWGSQIVLDLKKKAVWKHFVLNASGDLADRIVLDVSPADPLDGGGVPAASRRQSVSSGYTQVRPAGGGEPTSRLYVVAIDAGHGGSDPGAVGRYNTVEKHLALDMSRRIVEAINKYKGFKGVLTRDGDKFLDLAERIQIAQQKEADVFVSIHMNTAPDRNARGTEVYFISPQGAELTMNKLLENKQRAESELGLAGGQSAELLSMILDVNQQAMMRRSSVLAEEILNHSWGVGFPPKRGIKQRSFAVFKTVTMPSVLVETGFISNVKDARFLKSESGRQAMAEAIAKGIVSYLEEYPLPSQREKKVIVHKVKKGETLWRISKLYGSSVKSIRQVNGLSYSSLLQVGQELLIMNYQ